MKVLAVLEFDLEDESGNRIEDRGLLALAATDTEAAIRNRLMGHGFLADDQLIGTWILTVRVTDGPTDPALPP